MATFPIPERLARTSVAWEGDAARAWLAELPRVVTELADAWELDVGPPFEPGGNFSWVAPVHRPSDGLDAALKVQLPHPESDPEAAALAAWAGDGAVLLHAHDAERHALLVERCSPGTALADAGGSVELAAAGARIAARLHAAAPPAGVPTLAEVLDGWADELEARLDVDATGDPALGRLALETMRSLPRACAAPVLLHGDLNPTNLLSAEREPWLAIDPKPMVGDPARDGARLVLQPDPCGQPDPTAAVADRLTAVADALAVDREVLAAWCLADAVEIGTSARAHGDRPLADLCARQLQVLAPHL
jgi:streptomycin 6-kinase